MFGKVDPATALFTFFGFLVALTMHEAAHAFMAKALGDRSSETASRATLNPIPHIDIFGTIVFPALMLFSGTNLLFGWAKPTQFDARYFKKPKRDFNVATLAGPGCNFLIALLCGIAMRVMGFNQVDLLTGQEPVPRLLAATATANIVIGIFNFIPFPNSDGWKVMLNNVHYNTAQKLQELATPISIVVLMLLIFGIFTPVFSTILGLFYGLVLA